MRGADGGINDCMNFLSLPHRHNVDPGDVVEKRVCMEERRDLVLQMGLGSTPIIDLDRMMVTAVLGWFVLLVLSSLVSFPSCVLSVFSDEAQLTLFMARRVEKEG